MNVLRGLGVMSALIAIAVVGVVFGDRSGSVFRDVATTGASGAEEGLVSRDLLAARTVDRIRLLRTGDGPVTLTLGSAEVTALVNESLPGLLPEGVHDIEVEVRDGQVLLRASMVTETWSGADRLRRVMTVLPDTLRAEIRGAVERRGRRLMYVVTGARAHRLPLPATIVDGLVRDLPMSTAYSEPVGLQVRLPDGIVDVRVVGDEVILFAAEPIMERAVDGQDGA